MPHPTWCWLNVPKRPQSWSPCLRWYVRLYVSTFCFIYCFAYCSWIYIMYRHIPARYEVIFWNHQSLHQCSNRAAFDHRNSHLPLLFGSWSHKKRSDILVKKTVPLCFGKKTSWNGQPQGAITPESLIINQSEKQESIVPQVSRIETHLENSLGPSASTCLRRPTAPQQGHQENLGEASIARYVELIHMTHMIHTSIIHKHVYISNSFDLNLAVFV